MILNDKQIRANNLKLRQYRVDLDEMGKLLDKDIPEEERVEIVTKMQDLWGKIQEMKKTLKPCSICQRKVKEELLYEYNLCSICNNQIKKEQKI